MKRKISMLLVIVMLTSMLPTSVFAGNVDEGMESKEIVQTEECTHNWGTVEFTWTEDYSCTATRTCQECFESQSVDCSVTMEIVEEASCTEKGERVYTAVAIFDEETYTDEKYVSIESAGHKYNGNVCSECGDLLLSQPTATAKTYDLKKIKISWNKVANASGYYIYRATSKNGKYTKIKTASSSAQSYIDANKITGKTYYYKVIAYKGKVKSAESKVVSAKAGLATPVMKTSATSTGTSVKVSWGKVTSAKGYIVYRKTTSGSWKKIATIKSGSTLSYNDKTARGLYQYAVKAYTKVNGKTIYSNRANAIKARTLKQPSIEASGEFGQWNHTITWEKVAGATNYEIYRKIGTNGSWKKENTVGNVTSYITETVTHGKYYYYKVRAVYKNGDNTTTGSFSDSKGRIYYYYPSVRSFMSSTVNPSCGAVALDLTNNGVGKIRIYSQGAKLYDHDYSSYNRNLSLYDGNINPRSYIDIPAGQSLTFVFAVEGPKTWYDEKTQVSFKMYYDGVYYRCYVSRRYGFKYVKID